MKKLVHSLAAAGIMFGAAACDESSDAPVGAAARVRPAPEAAAAPAVVAGPAYVYAYNPMGKRDPFRMPQEENRRAELASACEEPLCQWDMDQLRLVAVVTGDANPIAMLQDPAGRGHVVRRNSRIGRQGGRVTQILRDSVTVTEYVSGVDGKVISNPVSLAITDDEKTGAAAYDLLTGRNFGE